MQRCPAFLARSFLRNIFKCIYTQHEQACFKYRPGDEFTCPAHSRTHSPVVQFTPVPENSLATCRSC